MVKEQKIEQTVTSNKDKPLIEYFTEDLLPQAILYGMTPSEFWSEDPSLMWSYHISYINKNKMEIDRSNFNNWLLGIYMAKAITVTMGPMLGSKKAGDYFKEPLDLKQNEYDIKDKSQLENKIKTRKQIEEDKIKAMFMKVKPKKI